VGLRQLRAKALCRRAPRMWETEAARDIDKPLKPFRPMPQQIGLEDQKYRLCARNAAL